VALDARVQRERLTPRVQLASMASPPDSAALHVLLQWGDREALEGRTLWFAVLREALDATVRRVSAGAARVVGPQDPLMLGLDTPGRVAVVLDGASTMWAQRVPAVLEALQSPIPDSTWRAARERVHQRVRARASDVSAVGFATAAAVAEGPYAATHPRHVPTSEGLAAAWRAWNTDAGQRGWDAEAARRWDAMRTATRWAVGAVGTVSDVATVRRLLLAVTGATPEPAYVPAIGATQPESRDVNVAGPASWAFAAAVVPVPVRQDDADWLPLRLGAWIAGGSPSAARFASAAGGPDVLGGGVSFDASATDRAGALTAWALVREPSQAAAVRLRLGTWLPQALAGLTDADVRRATDEWLAGRATDRQVPSVRSARLASDLVAGRTFADWDAVLEARARGLSAADIAGAWQRRVASTAPAAVIVRPANASAP
jgi:hypothetical protein